MPIPKTNLDQVPSGIGITQEQKHQQMVRLNSPLTIKLDGMMEMSMDLGN
jgi:hypothetical protein